MAEKSTQFFSNIDLVADFLSKLAEKSEDVYWLSSPNLDRIAYISPAYNKIWGRDREILYKTPEIWITYLHPDDALTHHPIHEFAKRVEAEGAQARYHEKYRIIRPDGEVRWIIDRGFPVYNKLGECVGVSGIAADVTKDKLIESALREAKERAEIANSAKSEFLASMSHDLRTPLSGIVSMTQLLRKRNKDPEQEKLFNLVSQGSKTLLRLIEEILDYSKLEAGKMPLYREAIDFRQLIEDVANIMAPEITQKKLQLLINYSDATTRQVIGDPHRLRRILMNLLSNALKFTQSGYIVISVEEISHSHMHVDLQLSVEDTGIGIPSDKLDAIFDRFSKLEPSYLGRYKGTGLGLTIVKQLVKSMEGEIGLHSQLGKGSTFWCSLPFEKQKVHHKISIWQRHYADVKILIVDDSPKQGHILQQQISTNNCHITSSKNAESQLLDAAINEMPYQIVIIDDELSNDISTATLAKSIHLHDSLQSPMLVLCTPPNNDNKLNELKKQGFFTYLIKPIQPTELVNTLAGSWGQWQSASLSKIEQIRAFKTRVLLVDDEHLSQTVMKILLEEELGCQIDLAKTGGESIALANENDYDLIFMDIGLPDQDGFSVVNAIRQNEDPNNPTVIIALTAHASNNIKSQCFETGMNGHLTKPTSIEDLTSIISRIIYSTESNRATPTSQSHPHNSVATIAEQ